MRSFCKCFVFIALTLPAVFASASAQERNSLAGTLQPFVDSHTLAGAVTLVASPEKVLALEAVGHQDLELNLPMSIDCTFWIASMSKPITGLALMLLLDEGKLQIDDPVERYLPEFKGQMLIAEKGPDRIVLKKPARPITIKDVLTHMSGLTARSPLEPGAALDTLTLREAVQSYALSPLQFEPGSQYQYNNPGINTAGRVVEVVSGMAFEDFLQKRLFGPLGMKDTTFVPSAAQLKRLAKSYKASADKKGLEATPIAYLSNPLDNPKRQAFPGGGLFSTASDLARICQMVLSGGVFEGKRYLSEAALKQMTSTQTGDLKVGGKDVGYGLGWATVSGPQPGFGHGGAYNTWMWIEPQQRLVLVLLMQHAGFPGSDGGKIRPAFQKAALERFGK